MKQIKALSLEQCWEMVNSCDSHEKIAIAEKYLLVANITIEEYDDLMGALAFTSRELDHNPTR